MVSFELGEELRKMFFRLVTGVGWRKILSPHEESNFRPSDLLSDTLPLSHRDSSVNEVYYEVYMTRVLHTARISNVDSVMFLDRNSKDGKFWKDGKFFYSKDGKFWARNFGFFFSYFVLLPPLGNFERQCPLEIRIF